jgi:hypothetical protein
MKKFIILIIILVAAFFGYRFFQGRSSTTTGTPQTNNTGSVRPDASSASFSFDDEIVTLSNGESAGGDAGEETSLLDEAAYGDLNNDGKQDTAVLLARSGGGSGVFVYVAAYVSGPVNYKGSNALFLGDRIAPQALAINNGVLTVTYLDRGEDEPFAAEPTISTKKEFIYRNGELQER